MNLPLFVVLGAACFTAGWWVDAWAASHQDDTRQPQTHRVEEAPNGISKESPPDARAALAVPTAVRSIDELLALQIPGQPNASRVRLDEAAAKLSAEELADFAEKLKAHDEDWRRSPKVRPARLAVLERWLLVEPAKAAEHMVPSYGNGDGLINGLVRPFAQAIGVLVQQDFESATRLAARIRGRELYIDVRWAWVNSLKGMDPEAALNLIVRFDSKTRNQWHNAQMLGDFPKLWIEKDAPGALSWALQLPAGYSREYILKRMTDVWAEKNPAEIRTFFENVALTVLPKGPLRKQLSSQVSKRENVPK
jgi:hypothetical protein